MLSSLGLRRDADECLSIPKKTLLDGKLQKGNVVLLALVKQKPVKADQRLKKCDGLKAAINCFGDNAIKASIKEVSQLHARNIFQPIHWHKLTEEESTSAIGSLIHIKEKQDGYLKD